MQEVKTQVNKIRELTMDEVENVSGGLPWVNPNVATLEWLKNNNFF